MSMQLLALLKAQDAKIAELAAEVAALKARAVPGAKTAALVQKLAEVNARIEQGKWATEGGTAGGWARGAAAAPVKKTFAQ